MVTTQLGVQWGDDAFGVWRVGAGEAAERPTGHRTVPTTEKSLARASAVPRLRNLV